MACALPSIPEISNPKREIIFNMFIFAAVTISGIDKKPTELIP